MSNLKVKELKLHEVSSALGVRLPKRVCDKYNLSKTTTVVMVEQEDSIKLLIRNE